MTEISSSIISLLFASLFALIGLNSILLFIMLKNRIYLFFSILVIGLACHASLNFFSQYNRPFVDSISIVTAVVTILGSVLFTREFLGVANYQMKRFDKYISNIIYVVGGCILFIEGSIILFWPALQLEQKLAVLAAFLAVVAICYNYGLVILFFKRSKLARLYLIINSSLLISSVAYLFVWYFKQTEAVVPSELSMVLIYGGMLLQMVLFSIFTGQKVKGAEQEKLEMQRSITKTLEQEVNLQTRNLQEAKSKVELQRNELQEANEWKKKMFSLVAHDLRSPLQNIRSLMELSEKGVLDAEQQQLFVDGTKTEISESMQILDRLLHWSYQQLDGISLEKKAIDLRHLVESVTKELEPICKLKNVSIELEMSHGEMVFDQNMLRVSVRNLLSNAIKFSYEGERIIIRVSRTANLISLSVQDFGMGMNPAWYVDLISTGKPQVKRGTQGEEGKGFGLLITKDFVELNDGNLRCKSQIGKGTTFSIEVPVN